VTELEERLRAGPEAVEALLRGAKRPLSLSDPPFWHGLAEGAGQSANWAFGEGNREKGLAWASCAVAIYDCLAADIAEPNDFNLSGMNLRTNAILACGSLAGPLLLDPLAVIDWVRSALVCSVDAAVARSARFKKSLAEGAHPSIDEARVLREMKTRLGVLARLAAGFPVGTDLECWIEARDQLV
jgi:hypothetical protein